MIQSHEDPYLEQRYKSFRKVAKESISLVKKRLSNNSKSKAELVTDFLVKRGFDFSTSGSAGSIKSHRSNSVPPAQ